MANDSKTGIHKIAAANLQSLTARRKTRPEILFAENIYFSKIESLKPSPALHFIERSFKTAIYFSKAIPLANERQLVNELPL